MARVKVVYDSLFAAITQKRQESVAVDGGSLLALLLRLGQTYGERFEQALFWPQSQTIRPEIAVLVNGQRGEPERPLGEGDEVVLLVPFAGG